MRLLITKVRGWSVRDGSGAWGGGEVGTVLKVVVDAKGGGGSESRVGLGAEVETVGVGVKLGGEVGLGGGIRRGIWAGLLAAPDAGSRTEG